MANCCVTRVIFYGEEGALKELREFLISLKEECLNTIVPDDDGGVMRRPTYKLMQRRLKISDEDFVKQCGELYEVEDMTSDNIGAYFAAGFEDAWNPHPESIYSILSKFPGIFISYRAEETGCGILEIHDPDERFFPERYLLDACFGEDGVYKYFKDEADLVSCFNKELYKALGDGIPVAENIHQIEEIMDTLMDSEELDDDCYANVHQFEEV